MAGWAHVTDKVEPHGYFPAYLKLAAELGPYGSVCEIGVAGGGSLEMFQHLFPLGTVCGVDLTVEGTLIDAEHGTRTHWPEGAVQVISEQTAPDLPDRLRQVQPRWDLIVDDASHEGPATTATFGLLWPLVRPGGYYVVEDWNGAFQNARQPGSPYPWGPGILDAVQGFLKLLWDRDAECDEITYRYGLAIIHRAGLR
jgi:cephalosporin hydroxylase